jgi:TRAP-type uncharacterized transport system fused permease subunit
MRARNLFRSWTDLFHGVLGFISSFLIRRAWFISLAITVAFIVYEAVESETRLDSCYDLTSFLCGFILGLYFCQDFPF